MQTRREIYLHLIDNTIAYLQALTPAKDVKPPPPVSKPKTKQKIAQPSPLTPKQKNIKPKKELSVKLELHLPDKPVKEPLDKMRATLKTIAPDLYFHDTPAADDKAKRIKSAWKEKSQIPDIPILFQGNVYRSFLNNVAKAVTLCFAPCRIVDIEAHEKEKKWDLFLESPQLKIILCPDHLLFSSKELLSFYKENPGQKTRFLGKIPLLLLPDLSIYFKDPCLKSSLWNVICQTLQLP